MKGQEQNTYTLFVTDYNRGLHMADIFVRTFYWCLPLFVK